jgi:guanine deaminase
MKALRAAILRFADDGSALYEEDGLLVVGPDAQGRQVVRTVGAYGALAPNYPGVAVEHLPGRILAPGFIDLHIHFPQTDVIGSPASGLLPWLEDYTFPHESRFADAAHAAAFSR